MFMANSKSEARKEMLEEFSDSELNNLDSTEYIVLVNK